MGHIISHMAVAFLFGNLIVSNILNVMRLACAMAKTGPSCGSWSRMKKCIKALATQTSLMETGGFAMAHGLCMCQWPPLPDECHAGHPSRPGSQDPTWIGTWETNSNKEVTNQIDPLLAYRDLVIIIAPGQSAVCLTMGMLNQFIMPDSVRFVMHHAEYLNHSSGRSRGRSLANTREVATIHLRENEEALWVKRTYQQFKPTRGKMILGKLLSCLKSKIPRSGKGSLFPASSSLT